MSNPNLTIDLQHGVVPISRAASALAALIKRSSATGKPIIITQKGYPEGVLLSIELYTALRTMATNGGELPITLPISEEPEEPTPRGRRGRKAAEAVVEAVAEPEPVKRRGGRRKAEA
jgi:prevent-host-death family protein